MIDNYTVGVSLTMGGNVGEAVKRLLEDFKLLNDAIAKAANSVKSLTDGLKKIDSLGASAAASWERAAAAMDRAAGRAGGIPNAAGYAPGAGGRGGDARERIGYSSAAGLLPYAPPGSGGGSSGGGGGGSGGSPPINLGSPLPPGGVGGSGIAHSRTLTEKLWGVAEKGFLAQMIGEAGGALIGPSAESSAILTNLKNLGVSPSDIEAAQNAARDIATKTPGVTENDVLAALTDVKGVLGGEANDPASLHKALEAIPSFANIISVFKLRGQQLGDEAFAGAKFSELVGHLTDSKENIDPARLQSDLDNATRVAVATNFRILPTDYLKFAKQARVAGYGLSDQELFKYLPLLMLEQGGQRLGTGEAAAYQQFVGGLMKEGRFNDLKKWGVLDKDAEWSGGSVKDISKHIKDPELLSTDISQWVWTVLEAAMKKAGMDGPNRAANVASFTADVAARQTGGGFIGSEITQKVAMAKDAASIAAVLPIADMLKNMISGDTNAQWAAFVAQWKNFLTEAGKTALPAAGELLGMLTKFLGALSNAAALLAPSQHSAATLKALTEGRIDVPWYARSPTSWFNSPASAQSIAPSAQAGQTVVLHGDVNLDKQRVGTIVAQGLASQANRPPAGGNGFDIRTGPLMPGVGAEFGP